MFEMDKKDEKKGKSELDDTIEFAMKAVVLIALILFCLPVLIGSIALFLIFRIFLPSKTRYFISLVALLLNIGLGFVWGGKIFLQPLAFYKHIPYLKDIIHFLEQHTLHGQVLSFDLKGFVSVVLLSLVGMSIADFVFSRLNVSWLTHEKEEDRQKYLSSDKYKKYFAKRVKIGEKHQEKYREKKPKDIFVGLNEKQEEVYLPIKSLYTHMLAQGTTGAGKTTLMYAIMEGGFINGLGSVFIDGKGDGTTEEELEKLTKKYGKKLYVFSDNSDWHYNPVGVGSATAIKDRLGKIMDWSDSFYEKEALNKLQQVMLFIDEYRKKEEKSGQGNHKGKPIRQDLKTIHRFLSLKEIAHYLFLEQSQFVVSKNYENILEDDSLDTNIQETIENKNNTEESQVFKKYMQMFFEKDMLTLEDIENIEEEQKESNRLIKGLRTQIELLIYSDFGEKFIDVPDKTLDIQKILLDGDVVLFTFDTNMYSDFMQSMGRFLVSDVASMVAKLHKGRAVNGYKGAIGFFDEFGSYVNDKILDILRKARSAKLGAVIGVQSISDFETKEGDLTKKARNNINLFFLGRSNDPDNAEDASNTVGTYKDIDRTVMTENQGGKLLRFETKGERGTVRKVQKYWFSPDEVKDMPNYTFIFLDKTTDKLEPRKEKVFVRNVLTGL